MRREDREAYEYQAIIEAVPLVYRSYAARITSFENGVWHGRVNLARDTVTFQATRGNTPAETVAAIRREFAASVDDYLAWAESEGFEPELPE
jgi:predicted HicB family RNase H-like nuclease